LLPNPADIDASFAIDMTVEPFGALNMRDIVSRPENSRRPRQWLPESNSDSKAVTMKASEQPNIPAKALRAIASIETSVCSVRYWTLIEIARPTVSGGR
jgi:hypothetical protein